MIQSATCYRIGFQCVVIYLKRETPKSMLKISLFFNEQLCIASNWDVAMLRRHWKTCPNLHHSIVYHIAYLAGRFNPSGKSSSNRIISQAVGINKTCFKPKHCKLPVKRYFVWKRHCHTFLGTSSNKLQAIGSNAHGNFIIFATWPCGENPQRVLPWDLPSSKCSPGHQL